MKPTHNQQSGFTIVEVLISIAFVLIIALLYQGTTNNLTLARESNQDEFGLRIAQKEIDALRQGGYDALPATGSFSSSDLSTLPSGSGTVTVTDFTSTVKQVVVTVQWKGARSGTNHSLSLTTAIAKTGGF